MIKGMGVKLLAGGALALGVLLAGCGTDQGASTGSTISHNPPAEQAAKAPVQTTPDMTQCTNQINYTGDPRSNAEINSIGQETGHCPPVQKAKPAAKAPARTSPDTTQCTDQINYAGDPRSNAEINSIGARTGHCPAPIH